ncbi:MAG: class I SAM-dependent methyltransferase, partial [Bacteroidota bacterium]
MSKLFQVKSYFQYYLRAKTIYNVHSPFAFEILNEVMDDEKHYYAFDILEKERAILEKDNTILEVVDHGAGSHINNASTRSISSIAHSALSKKEQCQQMFRLVQFMKPKRILELGTSLGLSSAYLSMAYQDVQIDTIEGSKEIYKSANHLFKKLKLKNINSYHGTFEEKLPDLLQKNQYDLIFIDGHHLGNALLQYFNLISNAQNGSPTFIIDDIHWSSDMYQAW